MNSRVGLKPKEILVIRSSMSSDIALKSSSNQALSIDESGIEAGWNHPQSKRLLRIDPKRQKIKIKIKKVIH